MIVSAPCSGEMANVRRERHQPARPASRRIAEARCDKAGMQAIGCDAGPGETAGELAGEENIGRVSSVRRL